MKIFLAAAFPDKIDPSSGEIIPEFKTFLSRILVLLRQEDHEVFCALEYDKWKLPDQAVELSLQKDLDEIDAADALVVVTEDMPSATVQFELGYGVAKDKQVILLRQSDDPLSAFNQGIVGGGHVTLLSFDNVSMLLPQLTVALGAAVI